MTRNLCRAGLVLAALSAALPLLADSQFNIRRMTRDDVPLRAKGPYRLLRHPTYAIVTVEVAVLPLAFGEWAIALIWSALNALLLWRRIRLENAALAPRRALG